MSSNKKIGLLISNLGSPSAPEKKAVRKYLKQFLSDKRVIQPVVPRWVWWLILNGIILNTRPIKSAKLYQAVWNKCGKGAPLLAITNKQLEHLRQRFENDNVAIAMGMRYGQPSLPQAIDELTEQGIEKLIVLPLYPQYSRTTTQSTFDVIHDEAQTNKNFPSLKLISNYHLHPLYIKALKHSVLQHWEKAGKPQKLVISFHGIPQVYCDNGDIYPQHCLKTAQLLVKELNLTEDEYLICYQSRFGKLEWLKPYLAETLKALPAQGITNVQVICPGFSADCLETLEEIEHENKNYFLQAGGEKYSYISALNDATRFIDCLEDLLRAES